MKHLTSWFAMGFGLTFGAITGIAVGSLVGDKIMEIGRDEEEPIEETIE